MLLAFTVVVVWEKFNDAEVTVAEEAGAIAALFHYTDGKEPEALAVRTALANYLKTAIEKDWPAMAREKESPELERALDLLYRAATALNRSGTRGEADMTEVFQQLDKVTAARRLRLHLASGLVPNIIWIALFMGALLTVGFTLFFGSENVTAQVSMTGILSILSPWAWSSSSRSIILSPARCLSIPIRWRQCSRSLASRRTDCSAPGGLAARGAGRLCLIAIPKSIGRGGIPAS